MKKFLNISNNTMGLFLMLLGQLSFAINDSLVKFMVKTSENNFTTLTTLLSVFKNGFQIFRNYHVHQKYLLCDVSEGITN